MFSLGSLIGHSKRGTKRKVFIRQFIFMRKFIENLIWLRLHMLHQSHKLEQNVINQSVIATLLPGTEPKLDIRGGISSLINFKVM